MASNGNGKLTPRETQLLMTAFKALTHELRVTALITIAEKKKISPSALATELKAPLGNVSYHVRQLADAQLVRLVGKKPRRGAIEHYYAITPFGTATITLIKNARETVATPEVQPKRRGPKPKDPTAAVKTVKRRRKVPAAA